MMVVRLRRWRSVLALPPVSLVAIHDFLWSRERNGFFLEPMSSVVGLVFPDKRIRKMVLYELKRSLYAAQGFDGRVTLLIDE